MPKTVMAALLMVLLPLVAAGQGADEASVRARFKQLVSARARRAAPSSAVGTLWGRYEALRAQEPAPGRRISLSAAADAVDADSTAAATVRRLAGAIRTKPEGTEAGLVVAPFLLFGSDSLRGFEMTFAALKNDVTRFGGSYTWDVTRDLDQRDFEQLPVCPVGEPDKEVEEFFVAACTTVIPQLPLGKSGDARDSARAACGLPSPTNMPDLVGNVHQVARVVVAALNDSAVKGDLRDAVQDLADRADEFRHWDFAHPYGCYESSDVEVFFKRLLWTIPKTRFAVSAMTDHLPRKYGFSPDGSKLPQGERTRWQLRADFARTVSGFELALGMGAGGSRTKPDEEFETVLTPSFTIAGALSPLSKTPLTTRNGLLNTNDEGDIPPHVVLGFAVSAELALDRPAIQTTPFNEVALQPYLDFFVNDKLSFRLGIPIKAEIVERKAQEGKDPVPPATEGAPAVPGQRSLQWTLPVAFVAVLNL